MPQADPTTPGAESERRRGPRRRVLKQVQILSLNKQSASAIDCTLRNMSSCGAQLSGTAATVDRIPSQFYLVAPGQLRMIRCTVVWKARGRVGVRFLSDPGQLAPAITAPVHQQPGSTGEIPRFTPPSGWRDAPAVDLNLPQDSADAVNPAGRLAALLSDVERIAPQDGRHLRQLPTGLLSPGSSLRQAFEAEKLEALAQSIREKGILQPLIVRRRVDGAGYEIVAGERRWRAAQLAGVHEVPVLIRRFNDAEALEIALIENVQRCDLKPLEEAKTYAQLVERSGYSQKQLASAIGKTRSYVANMLRLLTLPEEVKSHLEDGKLTAGHARALIASQAPVELAGQVIARKLNVRETERLASSQPGSGKRHRQRRLEPGNTRRDLERTVSEALGLKVEIVGAGRSCGRITVHVHTSEQLNEVCRRLSREVC